MYWRTIFSIFQVDFWRLPSHPGSTVDMRVSPHDFLKLTKLLNQYKIRHIVQIFDLQTVINRQNDVHNQRSSWYSEYHPLDEVYIMRYFPVVILTILLLYIQNDHIELFIIWITAGFYTWIEPSQQYMKVSVIIYTKSSQTCLDLKKGLKKKWIIPGNVESHREKTQSKRKTNRRQVRKTARMLKLQYREADQTVKRMARADPRAYMDELASQTENAANRREQGKVYKITKMVCGTYGGRSETPIKDTQGRLLTSEKSRKLIGWSTSKMSSTDPYLQLKQQFRWQRPT